MLQIVYRLLTILVQVMIVFDGNDLLVLHVNLVHFCLQLVRAYI